MIVTDSRNHWFDCEQPKYVYNKYIKEHIQVGCGVCPSCKKKKILRNVPNIIRESYCHKYTIFFTLTYSDEFLPHVDLNNYSPDLKLLPDYENYFNLSREFISLHKGFIPVCKTSDLQNFIKRLRINITRYLRKDVPIRYFISWDYGSTLFRPHYHGALFFNDEELHSKISEFIGRSWSVFDRHTNERRSIGRYDVQDAYNCARYISTYMQAIHDLPAIYSFKDFRIRSIHSSSPSFGSLVRSIETPEEVVSKGLTTITIYDPVTCKYVNQPLSSSYIYRYFPTIPSFNRLTRDQRYELYRIFRRGIGRTREERNSLFYDLLRLNSFFRDYITLNCSVNKEQLDRKLDVAFYAFKRLYHQSSIFGYSVQDYDFLVEKFYYSRSKFSLIKQFDYENTLVKLGYSNSEIDSIIDPGVNTNIRSLDRYMESPPKCVSPETVDRSYFLSNRLKFNSLIKRKCDNAYLEKHPEFKKFHS